MDAQIKTISINPVTTENFIADLDQALSIAGLGWYNMKYCLVLALFLIAGIIEVMGYSYILPAAKCDLGITDAQRGLIASSPYIAIVVTSFVWGYLVDTKGRKKVIIYSSLACGGLGILAAFMPELISFTFFKILTSLCLACPAAASYTLIGELLPPENRDLILSITNALQIMGSAMVPLLAWGILLLDFRIDFGYYDFRSWRLLAIAYSVTFLIASALMSCSPESPKFLLSQGKNDEAMRVLQKIYAENKRKSLEDFPVKLLKVEKEAEKKQQPFLSSLKSQFFPLLKPPYIKWLALNGFLLIGVFSTLNGLSMWVPDILNRILSGDETDTTACQIIAKRLNQTIQEGVCNDNIVPGTFVINSVANCTCAVVALLGSLMLRVVGKKAMLVFIYFIFGAFSVSINFITNELVFAVLLTSLQLVAVGIGPINAYGIDIFPTQLRGMAVSLGMMLGRSGSVIGINLAGVLINNTCETTFYVFGGLLILCGLLSFLLPRPAPTLKKDIRSSIVKHLNINGIQTEAKKSDGFLSQQRKEDNTEIPDRIHTRL